MLPRKALALTLAARAAAQDPASGWMAYAVGALPADARRRVAADLDRTPADVAKKLEDARNRVL